MTAGVAAAAEAPVPIDPFDDRGEVELTYFGLDPQLLGVPANTTLKVRVYDKAHYSADTLKQAAATWRHVGAVVLARTCPINEAGTMTVQGLRDVDAEFAELVDRYYDNPDVIVPTNIADIGNGTSRFMRVIPPRIIRSHFPPLVAEQARLEDVAKALGGPGTKRTLSGDEDAVNNQMWHDVRPYRHGTTHHIPMELRAAAAESVQNQGTHLDTPNVTVLRYYASVGLGGEFVLIRGLRRFCEESKRPLYGNINDTLGSAIIAEADISFDMIPVAPGDVIGVLSSEFHQVRRKTVLDVVRALRAGQTETPHFLPNGVLMTRNASNYACSTPDVQAGTLNAKEVVRHMLAHGYQNMDDMKGIVAACTALGIPDPEEVRKDMGNIYSSTRIYGVQDPKLSSLQKMGIGLGL
jgi:hypothetical protein